MKKISACVLLAATLLLKIPAMAQAISEPKMTLVEGGEFLMGSDKGEKNEKPVHKVKLNSFYIAIYETTQEHWEKLMGNNPSSWQGCAECPVESVSPAMVDEYLFKLNQLSGKHYRLPTEAEWEYAALGGNQSKGYRYSGGNGLNEVAWNKSNADNKTHPVGQKTPNELGLYDMSGNVWELCSDWYDPGFYKISPAANPRNDAKSVFRLLRGGSWRSAENRCYSKARNRNVPDHYKFGNGGFRVVLDQ